MADNEEEGIENDDKNAQIKTSEEEKAEKESTNEEMKTNNSPENQTVENGLPKEEHNDTENTTEETIDDKTKTENDEKDTQVVQRTEDDVRKEQLSRTVDLKLAQTHYKTHTKTTLPHILTEYGMEDRGHPIVKKEKKERKKKKKKSSGDEKDESEDEDRQRRKAREEKFKQTFGDMHQTDTYYMEYIDFLEKKVVSQRLKAEKQREEEKRLAALKEEEESQAEEQKKQTPPPVKDKKQKNRLHKRLQRIDVKHDDAFMKDLPRTDISRIIVLQDKMKREGKLKTQGEVDKFWQDIRKPDEFYSQFKIKPTDPLPRQPMRQDSDTNTNENSDVFEEPAMAPRSLSHISETSRGEREPWAITQKFASSHGPKTPVSRKSSSQLAKEAALDLEKRCPKLEMPPLSCFSLQLGEKPPDPEEIQKKFELKLKEKNRKKTQRKVQKMYQMAMTNTAAANRILAQHNDLTSMFEGAALRDVLSVFDEPIMTGIRRQVGGQVSTLEPYQYGVDEDLDAASYSQLSTRHSSASSGHKLTPISHTGSRPASKSRKSKAPLAAIEYPAAAPLSFNEVITREKTIEAKCLSTMWTNYMQAGKSIFAQT